MMAREIVKGSAKHQKSSDLEDDHPKRSERPQRSVRHLDVMAVVTNIVFGRKCICMPMVFTD